MRNEATAPPQFRVIDGGLRHENEWSSEHWRVLVNVRKVLLGPMVTVLALLILFLGYSTSARGEGAFPHSFVRQDVIETTRVIVPPARHRCGGRCVHGVAKIVPRKAKERYWFRAAPVRRSLPCRSASCGIR